MALYKTQLFQLRQLATDGGVVPAYKTRKLHCAEGARNADTAEQWKQRAVEFDPGTLEETRVNVRAGHHPGEVDEDRVKLVGPMRHVCILHGVA